MKSTEQIKKYTEMSNDALVKELDLLERELSNNFLKVQADKLQNNSVISKAKKNIARIKTILSAKSAE